jgi:hypothetical protein
LLSRFVIVYTGTLFTQIIAHHQKDRSSDFSPTQRLMRTSTEAVRAYDTLRFDAPSRYNQSWEPYIAANVYMFAVPFAIFIRRARELDFSGERFERSIQQIRRVLRVFSPDVVQAISRHLDDVHSADFGVLVRKHADILGHYAPPAGPMSMQSLQGDMQGLMEEVYAGHYKRIANLDVFQRLEAWFEGFVGRGFVLGEGSVLKSLVKQAGLIVGWPIDCQIGNNNRAKSNKNEDPTAVAADGLDRLPDGRLTTKGRQQLYFGVVKESPESIQFVGDRMRNSVRSHEISLLVNATIALSDYLNGLVGIEKGEFSKFMGFRFNLRFLADYRNLLWLSVAFLFLRLMW